MADDNNKTPKFVMDGTPVSNKPTTENILLRTQRSTNAAKEEDFSAAALKGLSEIRKAQILEAKDRGFSKYGNEPTQVVGVGMKKKADFTTGFTSGGSPSVDRMMPEIYSPLFQTANLNLPRDRMTMNAWNRNFRDTNPIVRNALTLHSTYPISKINVKCKHRKVEQFFNDMIERIDLFDAIAGASYEFWTNGECFPYAELDENNGIWSSIVIQNPDYITVKKTAISNIPVISLRPDEVIKKVVTSNHPSDLKLRSQISDNIIHHIRKNEPIPLDNFNISHLKMLSSPYDVRGTSIIVSCYKMLMLWDSLFECLLAQASSLINPITLISVGGTGEGEYHPSATDLQQYKEMFEAAQSDRDFKIITHAAVKVERIGASGAIVDTQNHFNFIREMLYAGLMVPKAVMDTEGSTYASASVGLEVLRTRYLTFRNMIEKWLTKKIFAPISQIQGFFEYKNKEKVLIVPEVDWNHINLYDLNDYIQALQPYVEKGKVSYHTLYRSLGLNYEEESRLIKEENIRTTILAKEAQELQKMKLVELRAINSDEPILDNRQAGDETVPGQTQPGMAEGGEGMPAELDNAPALPDMNMPAMPGAENAPAATPPPTETTAPPPEAPNT